MDTNDTQPDTKPEVAPQKIQVTSPVMDVQPPKPTPVAATPSPLPSNEAAVAEAPAETAAEISAKPASEPEEAEVPKPEDHNPMAIKPVPAAVKTKQPIGVYIMTAVVVIGLAGLTVFAYMKSGQNQPVATTTTQPQTETPEKVSTEVDATSKEADSTVDSLDNDTDFGSADLTDTTLGL